MAENTALPSTINNARIERIIRGAARDLRIGKGNPEYEHGHWWYITTDGRTYDAVDASGPDTSRGFGFEEV